MMTQNRDMFNSSLPSTSSVPQEASSSSGVRKIRIAIEVGHGGGDPGALFQPPFNENYEGEYDYWSRHAQTVGDIIYNEFERTKHRLPIPQSFL